MFIVEIFFFFFNFWLDHNMTPKYVYCNTNKFVQKQHQSWKQTEFPLKQPKSYTLSVVSQKVCEITHSHCVSNENIIFDLLKHFWNMRRSKLVILWFSCTNLCFWVTHRFVDHVLIFFLISNLCFCQINSFFSHPMLECSPAGKLALKQS